jgi:hypothetical protein
MNVQSAYIFEEISETGQYIHLTYELAPTQGKDGSIINSLLILSSFLDNGAS